MTGAALVGLIVMIVSETATLAQIEPFWSWNTPIAWTGFILFADGVVFRARGHSWIRSAPREFAFLATASIPLWLVFEFYNRFIDNWYYVNLPELALLRYVGYAWSFATIWPAIFEGAELVGVWRGNGATGETITVNAEAAGTAERNVRKNSLRAQRALRSNVVLFHKLFTPLQWMSIAIGGAMLVWPLVWPSRYLAAPVWLGFIFLLDPINGRLGGPSLAADLVHREYERIANLAVSGLLCGFLWEFWNYWSRAKWHYTVPIMESVKIFEMPLPGYFGFPAFALECFTMYAFVRLVWVRLRPDTATGPRCNLPEAAI